MSGKSKFKVGATTDGQVVLLVDDGNATLNVEMSPEQARQIGKALIDSADVTEAVKQRPSTVPPS